MGRFKIFIPETKLIIINVKIITINVVIDVLVDAPATP